MYEIYLENESIDRARAICEPDGTEILVLEPQQRLKLYTRDAAAFLAQWESIVFMDKAPWAKLRGRPVQPAPLTEPPTDAPLWEVVFLNIGMGGPVIDIRSTVTTGAIHLMRGIPVRVLLPPTDPMAVYERIEANQLLEFDEPVLDLKGYTAKAARVGDKFIDRPEKELARIMEQIEELTK